MSHACIVIHVCTVVCVGIGVYVCRGVHVRFVVLQAHSSSSHHPRFLPHLPALSRLSLPSLIRSPPPPPPPRPIPHFPHAPHAPSAPYPANSNLGNLLGEPTFVSTALRYVPEQLFERKSKSASGTKPCLCAYQSMSIDCFCDGVSVHGSPTAIP